MPLRLGPSRFGVISELLAASPTALLLVASHGDRALVEYVNLAFSEMTGLVPDEVLGHDLVDLMRGRNDPQTLAAIEAAVRSATPLRRTIELVSPEGGGFHVDFNMRPSGHDERVLVVALSQVTELIEARRDREEHRRAVRKIVSSTAHDLRNPLGAIEPILELMKAGALDEAEQAEMIDAALESTTRMRELIDDMLVMSEFSATVVELDRAEVEVDVFVERSLATARKLADHKGIDVVTDLLADTAAFDEGRLRRVIENLMSNAIKYSHSGTTITIRCRRVDSKLRFEVVDEGPGIIPEELSKVFVAYQRTSNAPTAGEGSTGLGLPICKEIVELHGGEIGVESTPGVGSTFWFEIPLV